MNTQRISQDFFNAGLEYARVWKDENSNPETQTPDALLAAASQEFDAYWTASHEEWTPSDYRELAISCFIDGFGNYTQD